MLNAHYPDVLTSASSVPRGASDVIQTQLQGAMTAIRIALLLGSIFISAGARAGEPPGPEAEKLSHERLQFGDNRKIPERCKEVLTNPDRYGKCTMRWVSLVDIGAALPAISFRFDGEIGFLNQVAPLEIGFNLFQSVAWDSDNGEHNGLVAWRPAIGISVAKPPESASILFGVYIQPWGLRYNNFSFGLAVAYLSDPGKMTAETRNFSFTIPISYSFGL